MIFSKNTIQRSVTFIVLASVFMVLCFQLKGNSLTKQKSQLFQSKTTQIASYSPLIEVNDEDFHETLLYTCNDFAMTRALLFLISEQESVPTKKTKNKINFLLLDLYIIQRTFRI